MTDGRRPSNRSGLQLDPERFRELEAEVSLGVLVLAVALALLPEPLLRAIDKAWRPVIDQLADAPEAAGCDR